MTVLSCIHDIYASLQASSNEDQSFKHCCKLECKQSYQPAVPQCNKAMKEMQGNIDGSIYSDNEYIHSE